MPLPTDAFSWSRLGDIEAGRPNLGPEASVASYRLFHFSLRQILDETYGPDVTDELLRKAGMIAGKALAESQLDSTRAPFDFIADLQKKLAELKIGILRIEQADLEKLSFVFTVSEDLDCSGLPLYGTTICKFDEGLIAGVMEHYLHKDFDVVEIDCWTTGAKTCRFTVNVK